MPIYLSSKAARYGFSLLTLCGCLWFSGIRGAAQETPNNKAVLQKTSATSNNSVRSTRREVPNFGRVEVTTNPGSYPVLIDGQANGTTSAAMRAIDLEPGRHTIEIAFPNGRRWTRELNVVAGRKQCINLNYNPPPACTLAVGSPARVGEGETIVFKADVTGADRLPVNYVWSVSPSSARILSGQGTPTITVDSTGLSRDRVTAVLNVANGASDPICQCKQTAQSATDVLAPVLAPIASRRFDAFPSISFDDDKARLDNFAIELQNNPGATGYVVVYGNRFNNRATLDANRLRERAQNYLTATRGIDANRLTVINGGLSDRSYYELWVVPKGARPPQLGAR